MVGLDFTDAGQYVRTAGVKERAGKYDPEGRGDFPSIPGGKQATGAAKSFTRPGRRIVHSRPKNKAATLFKPEVRYSA